MSALVRLSQYPHARVRVACGPCGRQGRWSVARLAERYGAEISLLELVRLLTADCKLQRQLTDPIPRTYEPRCCALIVDPPDPAPAAPALRVVRGGRG